MLFNYKYVLILILLLFVTSCFTEVENTKKITEKDVEKVLQNQKNSNLQESIYNHVTVDSFPNWEKGRKFYVVDSNVRRIFTTSVLYDIDTLDLAGSVLEYTGYEEGSVFDNEPRRRMTWIVL